MGSHYRHFTKGGEVRRLQSSLEINTKATRPHQSYFGAYNSTLLQQPFLIFFFLLLFLYGLLAFSWCNTWTAGLVWRWNRWTPTSSSPVMSWCWRTALTTPCWRTASTTTWGDWPTSPPTVRRTAAIPPATAAMAVADGRWRISPPMRRRPRNASSHQSEIKIHRLWKLPCNQLTAKSIQKP